MIAMFLPSASASSVRWAWPMRRCQSSSQATCQYSNSLIFKRKRFLSNRVNAATAQRSSCETSHQRIEKYLLSRIFRSCIKRNACNRIAIRWAKPSVASFARTSEPSTRLPHAARRLTQKSSYLSVDSFSRSHAIGQNDGAGPHLLSPQRRERSVPE